MKASHRADEPLQALRERVPFFRSLRIQLIVVFVLSLAGATAVSWTVYFAVAPLFQTKEISYRQGMEHMDASADQLALRLRSLRPEQEEAIRSSFARYSRQEDGSRLTVLLVDPFGKVLLQDPALAEDQIDPFAVIQTTSALKSDRTLYRPGSEYTAYAPVDWPATRAYVLLRGVPAANVLTVQRYSPLGAIAGGVALFAFFYLLTRRKILYMEELADGLLVISQGRLAHRVPERNGDELGSVARSINLMAAELERNIEGERQAERIKAELITGISHDLRTPLTSIKGYLHLLHSGKDESPEQVARYIRIAYAKTEQLQQMVEDLFEYSKLSGLETRLNRQVVCMNDLLKQMVEEYAPLCSDQELAFATVMPDKLLTMSADPERLGRVFDNLLTNAVKYAEKPGRIEVRLAEKTDGILVTVENRGPAIPRDDLENLFAPFFRLDESRSSAAPGSGLGLAIARRIVELHGGEIWAESEGGLVRFCVWLPSVE